MCDGSDRLIAWMDGELAPTEAAVIERHVRACKECGERLSTYEQVSREFAGYYAAMQSAEASKRARPLARLLPVPAAAAALAVIVLALMPHPGRKQVPAVPQVEVAPPPPVVQQTSVLQFKPAAKPRVATRRKPPDANWTMAEPAIQIAIPAEAIFPPGAMPAGATYIASLSLAPDGWVQEVRLQQRF